MGNIRKGRASKLPRRNSRTVCWPEPDFEPEPAFHRRIQSDKVWYDGSKGFGGLYDLDPKLKHSRQSDMLRRTMRRRCQSTDSLLECNPVPIRLAILFPVTPRPLSQNSHPRTEIFSPSRSSKQKRAMTVLIKCHPPRSLYRPGPAAEKQGFCYQRPRGRGIAAPAPSITPHTGQMLIYIPLIRRF